ncbi:protein LURP-one-related 4-like [Neltuma alba]|uniref:protein LURP-one-related 4-like n=1 Tax=Neltuma alba TaxID=207710 RepID=UPI0010A3590D|nr:protein LURP-one-related 4-like [Prosopis alba]
MMSSKRETYTVWMKSLVFHSNGCTVYNSNGDIVYRVDNYDTKGTREVNLMDLQGTVLCTIHKRKLRFGCWEGFRSSSRRKEKRWFQVKRCQKMMMKGKAECEMRVGSQKYWIVGMGKTKAAFGIINIDRQIVAEVKQKESWLSGVVLGDDVVTLEVDANTDHSLMMAFVTVYGLMRGRM